MILKYLSFLVGLIWSYSIIKTQSIFSKKTGLIFKIFISKVSWLTFLVAIYFGYKNFSFQYTLIGILVAVATVHAVMVTVPLLFFTPPLYIFLSTVPSNLFSTMSSFLLSVEPPRFSLFLL